MKGEKLSFSPPFNQNTNNLNHNKQRRFSTPNLLNMNNKNRDYQQSQQPQQQKKHGLGRRSDRNSHDESAENTQRRNVQNMQYQQQPQRTPIMRNENNQKIRTYAKKHPQRRAATPDMTSNGSVIPPPKYNNLNKPKSPKLYHPIPGPITNALPTRQDAAALQAAGYQHELYYLPMDDLNEFMFNDPLVAYDLYFGVNDNAQTTQHQQSNQHHTNNNNYNAYQQYQQYQKYQPPQTQNIQSIQRQTMHNHYAHGQRQQATISRSAPYGATQHFQHPKEWNLDKIQKNQKTALSVLSSTK